MRALKSGTLITAAAQIYRKLLLRSSPICDFSHHSLSSAAGFGMRRLNSTTLFASAAAQIYRKQLLRSATISHRFLSSAAGFAQGNSRRKLPAELSALWNLTELTCESAADGGVCQVFLIGTMHHLQFSRDQVKALTEFVKPEAVFVELCHRRAHYLKPENNKTRPWEFFVANEEAKKHGAKTTILGDLPLNLELVMLSLMVFVYEFSFLPYTVSYVKLIDIIKKCFKKDYRGAFYLAAEEIARTGRFGCEFFFNERDQYMSAKLLEVARRHKSVVAVVGMGHL